MGAGIELRCGTCGPVVVDPAVVDVHVNRHEDFVLFGFLCPGCGEFAVGGDRSRVQRLLDAGARRLELRSTTAPAFTLDDVLGLHAWLDSDPVWDAPV